MSIKFFHLFFIVVCALFSLGVGGWGVVAAQQGMRGTGMGVAIFFLLFGAGLAAYAVYFYRKWKDSGIFL